MSSPAGYTQLLALSRQMLALAKSQEWEALAQIEAQRAELLASLPRLSAGRGQSVIGEIANTIRQIQEIDREVLDYVMPWREHAAVLLSRLESPPNTSA